MKKLLLILIIFQLNSCKTNTTNDKHQVNSPQKLKDSAFYKNNKLAYKKKGNTVKFYNYKGKLEREMNLNTRIEKTYNLTGESMEYEFYPDEREIFLMRNGYCSYADLILTPKGSSASYVGKDGSCNMAVTTYDRIDTIPKNNLGYPTSLKFNETGQITGNIYEKREFDSLGRIQKQTTPNKTIEYIYEHGTLKESKHKGRAFWENLTKEYVLNSKGQLSKVKSKYKNGIQTMSFYTFSNDLLQTKKTYRLDRNQISVKIIEYTYDDKKRCINETYFELLPKETLTMSQIENEPDLALNKNRSYLKKSTDYIFKGTRFIGVKEINLIAKPHRVTKDWIYTYNKYNQLNKSIDVQENTEVKFYYNN